MSQYTQFFIKTNDNIFYPIGTFSRNDARAAAINDILPYESIRPLTKSDCVEVIDDLEKELEAYKDSKRKYNNQIEWLKTATGNLDERLDRITEYFGYIKEIDEEMPYIYDAIGFYKGIMEIIDEAEMDEKYGEGVEYGFNLKGDSYVYAGIEVGNPNIVYKGDDFNRKVVENKLTGYKKED